MFGSFCNKGPGRGGRAGALCRPPRTAELKGRSPNLAGQCWPYCVAFHGESEAVQKRRISARICLRDLFVTSVGNRTTHRCSNQLV